jgi:hypothetical protein
MSLPDPSTPLITHVLVADNGHARLMRVVGPQKKRGIEQEELFESGTAKTRRGAAADHDAHTAEILHLISREISGDYPHADPQQLLRLVEDAADR